MATDQKFVWKSNDNHISPATETKTLWSDERREKRNQNVNDGNLFQQHLSFGKEKPAETVFGVEHIMKDSFRSRLLQSSDSGSNATSASVDGGEGASMELQLWFSVWFPAYSNAAEDEADYNDLVAIQTNEHSHVRRLVLDSFLALLCRQTEIRVLTNSSRASSTKDLCTNLVNNIDEGDQRQRRRSRRRRRLNHERFVEGTTEEIESQYERPTIIYEPQVTIRRRSQTMLMNITNTASSSKVATKQKNKTMAWTVWTITYPVLHVGDLYVQETLLNQPDLGYAELRMAALETMKEVIQLAVDVNLLDGNLDAIYADIGGRRNHLDAYASPIRLEWDTFYPIYVESYTMPPYVPRVWYPMRISGIAIAVFSILSVVLLTVLSRRRRKRLNEEEQKRKLLEDNNYGAGDNEDVHDDRWLNSNVAVENMLDQSSRFSRTYQPENLLDDRRKDETGDSEIASNNPNVASSKKSLSPSLITSNYKQDESSPRKHAVGQVVLDIIQDNNDISNGNYAWSTKDDLPKSPGSAILGRNTVTGDAYFANSSIGSRSNSSTEELEDGGDESLFELLRHSQQRGINNSKPNSAYMNNGKNPSQTTSSYVEFVE